MSHAHGGGRVIDRTEISESAAVAVAPEPARTQRERLVSLDALRGFDMFWIVGAATLVKAVDKLGDHPALVFLRGQLTHRDWEGLTAYDVIFPLFVFICGVSLVLSLGPDLAADRRRAAYNRLLRRAALLFVLGVFYNGGLKEVWPEVRIMGVLQRIALSYLLAGIALCHFRAGGLLALVTAILGGYWLLLTYVPAGGFPAGSLAPGQNVVNWFDARFLPGRLYDGTWDPEGILSTFPSVATCLIGVLAGLCLTSPRWTPGARFGILLVGAAALGCAGWYWGESFPVIKKLWTSSYVLLTGGISLGLLAVFYLVVDVMRFRRWAAPFVWIGANPLALYLSRAVIDYRGVSERLAGGSVHAALGRYGDVALHLLPLVLILWLARFLYVRRVFIRV